MRPFFFRKQERQYRRYFPPSQETKIQRIVRFVRCFSWHDMTVFDVFVISIGVTACWIIKKYAFNL